MFLNVAIDFFLSQFIFLFCCIRCFFDVLIAFSVCFSSFFLHFRCPSIFAIVFFHLLQLEDILWW
jgi:hypothetical protein